MRVVERGVIFDAVRSPPHERVAFFTSLRRLDSGALLASFQLGPKKHGPTATIGLCRSQDDGRTWRRLDGRFATTWNGTPGSLAAGELLEAEPGRLLLFATWIDRSEPDRPLFDPVTEGLLPTRQLVAVSHDEGETWSEWREIDLGALAGCATTGPAIRFADGTIAHAFESFKDYRDPRPSRHAAWLVSSRDGGRSFAAPQLVARHPRHERYYWDQRLCVAGAGDEFVALFWTHDLAEKKDRNVHFARRRMAELPSLSPDCENPAEEGPTPPSPPIETNMRGQIAAPLVMSDGRLLAFVVDRTGPATMKLWQSRDGGQTWPNEGSFVVYEHDERAALSQGAKDIDFKKYWEDMGKWSFGHPALVALSPGVVMAAYYAGSPDTMSIHWARVAVEG